MADKMQREQTYPNVISNDASAEFVHQPASFHLPVSNHSDEDEENKDEVEGTMEGLVGNRLSNMQIQSSGKSMKTRS